MGPSPQTAATSPSRAIANTLGLESIARNCVSARSPADVIEAAHDAAEGGNPLLVLGEGSNVVLPPELAATVVYIEDDSITVQGETANRVHLRVGAGLDWHALVLATLERALYGLENLALIPGRVGAAPVQNIGAYGRELSEFVVGVHGVDTHSRTERYLDASECAFAYRDSVFKHALRDRFVITAVDLALYREPRLDISYPGLRDKLGTDTAPTADAICAAVVALRREKLPDPRQRGNAGSFFKNPVVDASQWRLLAEGEPLLPGFALPDGRYKIPAAWLIDRCGLKGLRRGAAAVSERHALVIENCGGATQADVLDVAHEVIDCVAARFAIHLEPEPRLFE